MGKFRKDMKWSCSLGLKKCITFRKIKLGCLGAMAFAYIGYAKKDGMKLGPISIPAFSADAAGGVVAQFMKFTKTLLDVGACARLQIPQFFFKVWLKKFDMKTMGLMTVFEFKKGNMPDPTDPDAGDGDDAREVRDSEEDWQKKDRRIGESMKQGSGNPLALVMGAIEKAKAMIKAKLIGYLMPVDICKAKQPPVKFVPKAEVKERPEPEEEGDGDGDDADKKSKKLGESAYIPSRPRLGIAKGKSKGKGGVKMKQGKVGVDAKGFRLKAFSEMTFRKTLFEKNFKVGVPMIGALLCSITLAGMMGLQYGFGVDEKTMIVAMAQAQPMANVVFKFDAFGTAGPFAGGLVVKLTIFDARVPINAVIAPLAMSLGYDVSWKVTALQAKIMAFFRGPGMKCKNKAGRDRAGRCVGKGKTRICVGKGKGKSKGKDKGKRREALLREARRMYESEGTNEIIPGINNALNPTPAKALSLQFEQVLKDEEKYQVLKTKGIALGDKNSNGVQELGPQQKLGENAQFMGKLGKLVSALGGPCLTTPCNLWWVPNCKLKCGIGEGCDYLKGTKVPKPLYEWKGINKGASIITKNQKCVKAPPPQAPPAGDGDGDGDGGGDDDGDDIADAHHTGA